MDDIIDGMHYDGKHSWEDTICRAEEACQRWGSRIAILGGIDVDFVCRRTPQEVHDRTAALMSAAGGRWVAGTGNSVPKYVPRENYLALVEAVVAGRPRRQQAA